VPSKPGRATVVFADYAPTNHLGGDWQLRVLAWRIIGGAEWSELRQMQIWMIDSASIFAPHCRQTEANFQYFYGTNSPSLLPTSLSSSHSSRPLASFDNLLLYYTHILICHLVELSCGVTEHLRGRRACFFPPRTSLQGCQ
jgi:hypothetical protein